MTGQHGTVCSDPDGMSEYHSKCWQLFCGVLLNPSTIFLPPVFDNCVTQSQSMLPFLSSFVYWWCTAVQPNSLSVRLRVTPSDRYLYFGLLSCPHAQLFFDRLQQRDIKMHEQPYAGCKEDAAVSYPEITNLETNDSHSASEKYHLTSCRVKFWFRNSMVHCLLFLLIELYQITLL